MSPSVWLGTWLISCTEIKCSCGVRIFLIICFQSNCATLYEAGLSVWNCEVQSQISLCGGKRKRGVGMCLFSVSQ